MSDEAKREDANCDGAAKPMIQAIIQKLTALGAKIVPLGMVKVTKVPGGIKVTPVVPPSRDADCDCPGCRARSHMDSLAGRFEAEIAERVAKWRKSAG